MASDVIVLVEEPDVVTVCKPASVPVSRLLFTDVLSLLNADEWGYKSLCSSVPLSRWTIAFCPSFGIDLDVTECSVVLCNSSWGFKNNLNYSNGFEIHCNEPLYSFDVNCVCYRRSVAFNFLSLVLLFNLKVFACHLTYGRLNHGYGLISSSLALHLMWLPPLIFRCTHVASIARILSLAFFKLSMDWPLCFVSM